MQISEKWNLRILHIKKTNTCNEQQLVLLLLEDHPLLFVLNSVPMLHMVEYQDQPNLGTGNASLGAFHQS